MIPFDVFLDKNLSDAIRKVVISCPCDYDEALRLLNISRNYLRDVEIIIKLKISGMKELEISKIIQALNN